MPSFINFVLRLFLVMAGLLFAASLAVGFTLMLAFWSLRAGWARLTGRPVMPFIMRVTPRSGFERMYRRAAEGRAGRAGSSVRQRTRGADVTDVEPRPPSP